MSGGQTHSYYTKVPTLQEAITEAWGFVHDVPPTAKITYLKIESDRSRPVGREPDAFRVSLSWEISA